MASTPKQEAQIPAQLDAIRLDDAPQVKRHGAFVTKITKSHVFFVCMHIGYCFRKKAVQFPEGIQPGWWIGLERTDGKGVNDEITGITNVRRDRRGHSSKSSSIQNIPKRSVHAKFVKRDLSAYLHMAKRVQDEFQKTVPAEFCCEEIGEFTDPYGLADVCKDFVFYDCVIILKMNSDGWDPEGTTVPNMTKTLLGVGKRCPKEELPNVMKAPWICEQLTIIHFNEMPGSRRVGFVYAQKRIPGKDTRKLFLWNKETGPIQVKLEKEYAFLPHRMVGESIVFKLKTIAADEDKGYVQKGAFYCGEVERGVPTIHSKTVNVDDDLDKYALAKISVNCPADMARNQVIHVDNYFFGELEIHNDLTRACLQQNIDVHRLAGKNISVYLKLTDDLHWEMDSIDPVNVEKALRQ